MSIMVHGGMDLDAVGVNFGGRMVIFMKVHGIKENRRVMVE